MGSPTAHRLTTVSSRVTRYRTTRLYRLAHDHRPYGVHPERGSGMPPPVITTGACMFQHHTVTCGLPPKERPLAAFAEEPLLERAHLLASRQHPQGAPPLKRPH